MKHHTVSLFLAMALIIIPLSGCADVSALQDMATTTKVKEDVEPDYLEYMNGFLRLSFIYDTAILEEVKHEGEVLEDDTVFRSTIDQRNTVTLSFGTDYPEEARDAGAERVKQNGATNIETRPSIVGYGLDAFLLVYDDQDGHHVRSFYFETYNRTAVVTFALRDDATDRERKAFDEVLVSLCRLEPA